MIRVGFRVDGGSNIGMGHIMRCLALAKAFPDDINISFITKKENNVLRLLENYNFRVITISSDLDYKSEINKVKCIILDNKFDILITDSYQINQGYLINLKEVAPKLVSIHDFAPFAFPSDVVINGNIYAEKLVYKSLDGNTKFLLGTKYTLMRDEFQNLPKKKINGHVKNIMITTGGSDLLNITPKALKAINLLDDSIKSNIKLDIVIGSSFTNLSEIINEIKSSNLEIDLHFNTRKMSKLMIKSDLAISAGGSTLYELATTGTPTITLLQAENQVLAAEAMYKMGVIRNLGFSDKISSEELIYEIKLLIENYDKRREMAEKGQLVVGGQGAKRSAQIILNRI